MGLDFEKSKMNSKIVNDNEWPLAMELGNSICLHVAMRATIELNVFQIIANASNGVQLSPAQIVDHIPNTNPDAAITLDRILRVLASHSVLSCSVKTNENGKVERFYGLTAVGKYFVNDQFGVSLAPQVLMNQDKVLMESWVYLRDAVIEGSHPFTKAHQMNAFEEPAIERFKMISTWAKSENSTILMNKILETYEGFEEVQELVFVGGGIGSTLNLIVSRYPHISGVNFDLSHVLADAPHYPGVTHVAGNMFESVPSGQAIFMKLLLHDWSDDHCRKLLKNCHMALPEKGKVISVDTILPVAAETSPYARQGFHSDLMGLAYKPGGKERTEQDFQDLAKETGFAGGVDPVCCVNGMWVMEFHK